MEYTLPKEGSMRMSRYYIVFDKQITTRLFHSWLYPQQK